MSGGALNIEPAPALLGVNRVPEAGVDTRQYIGLDRNERTIPLPDWFIENIKEAVTSDLLTQYPRLAQHLGVAEKQLILSPSSDAAFKALYQAYVRKGDSVVMLDPSYAMFPVYANMFQGKSVLVPFNEKVELDVEYLLHSIQPGVRLVIIANPNQPTATIVAESVLRDVIKKAEGVGALVAMDEAYYPFGGVTALHWLPDSRNLLIIRTFSKAAGLAGLRLGYVAGDPEVIHNLYKVRTVNDVNSMSILCADEILKHPEIIDDYVAQIEAGEAVLRLALPELGLEMLPTHANFVVVRVVQIGQPYQFVKALKSHGYLTRALESECMADYIRITLGSPEMMRHLATSLKEIITSGELNQQ